MELRLAVNAGSLQEDDDQQGFAHFLEHMAFIGAKHFRHNSLIDFLEASGIRFGADLNTVARAPGALSPERSCRMATPAISSSR